MESQEAKLYRGEEYIKSLCLLGYNDDFDEIVVVKDGSTFEDEFNKETRTYEPVSRTYKGITRISFK